jgi:hypothetical protein
VAKIYFLHFIIDRYMADNGDIAMKAIIALVAVYVLFKLTCNNARAENMRDYFDEEEFAGPSAAPVGAPQGANPDVIRTPPGSISAALLPDTASPEHADFAEFAPNVLEGQNFLDAKAFIGLNSVSGSLRNPNLSVRREPPNPQTPVGPWNVSTIIADPYRTGLTDVC